MDEKLAKGISRSLQRALAQEAIPLSDAIAEAGHQAMYWSCGALNPKGKSDPKFINVRFSNAAHRLATVPAMLRVSRTLLKPDTMGAELSAAFVWRSTVQRFDQFGRLFRDAAWLVSADRIVASPGIFA